MALKKKAARALVLGVTAATALVVSMGTASANNQRANMMEDDEVVRGFASFYSSGDSFAVCDKRADGHGVRGYVVDEKTGRKIYSVRAVGMGKCVRKDYRSVNLKEGHRYGFWWVYSDNASRGGRLFSATA